MEKTEYKLKTKIGQTVYHIEINLRADNDNSTSSLYPSGVFVNPYKIVFQSQYKIALNNEWITTFDRLKKGSRKESYQHAIGYPEICVKTNETFWANGVFAHIYVLGNEELVSKEIEKLKAEMVALVKKQYGFLSNDFEGKIWDLTTK